MRVYDCVYEEPAVRTALDDVLRPGGLELTDEALAACALPAGAFVVDVGCGAGATVDHLRSRYGFAAMGMDASAVLLASARDRFPGLPVARALAERLPVGTGVLDAVLAECMLSLTSEPGATLAEFHRVLKTGGRLILADIYLISPDSIARPRAVQPASCLQGALTRSEIEVELAEQGFSLVTWQDRSAALKVMTARLILAGIPPARFWGAGCGPPSASGGAGSAGARPGYYWLIASAAG